MNAAANDAASLLAVDLEAELRKLGLSRLDGPWQLPAELLRLAVRRGARTVSVEITARRLHLTDDAPALPEAARQSLRRLAQRDAPDDARHAALVALERAGLSALIGAADLGRDACDVGDGWLTLGHAPLDAARARAWLRSVARFAPPQVSLDGAPLPGSGGQAWASAGAYAARALRAPLVGQVAWTGRRDGARVWLLAGGVLSTHLHLPDAPSFEALLECDALCRPDAGAEERREAVRAHAATLVEQAVALLVDACAGVADDDPQRGRHLRRELLRAARARVDLRGVMHASAFPALLPPDGERRFLSLYDVACASERARPARTLTAAEPGVRAADLVPSAEPIFLLDVEERSHLAEIAGVSFAPASLRQAPSRLAAARRALAALARRARSHVARHCLRLREDELEPPERALRDALEGELRASPEWPLLEVCLHAGDGPPRLTRTGAGLRLELPRGHASVRSARRAVAADAGWVYAAALALLHEAGWRGR